MAHQASGEETVFQIAQALLGNGTLAHRLEMAGWDGQDPQHRPPAGTMVNAPGERPGPPVPWMLDPKRWGRQR